MPSRKRRAGGGLSVPPVNSAPPSSSEPLTARQAEILEWIAAGKRNQEIAKIFKLSARTVEKHVEKILERLGVETRTGASFWWHEQRRQMERGQGANGT